MGSRWVFSNISKSFITRNKEAFFLLSDFPELRIQSSRNSFFQDGCCIRKNLAHKLDNGFGQIFVYFYLHR